MPDAVIVSACRTAIGTAFKGSLTETTAFDLADAVVSESVARTGLRDGDVDDIVLGEVLQVEATFRDSWADPVDGEGVLHEYVLTAAVDRDGTLLSATADPRVLPYGECPRAAASPQLLVGQHVAAAAGLPAGTSSCTHLNDLLRTLACVPGLALLAGDDAAR
jgi:hypothetical protein